MLSRISDVHFSNTQILVLAVARKFAQKVQQFRHLHYSKSNIDITGF